MFRRPHHQRIAKVLQAFDAEFLRDADCFFGGGTAIVLQLGEYRESVDIDFLCASIEGYGKIRRAISSDLGRLLKTKVKHLREVRADKDKISTILEMDGEPIKVEIFKEAMMAMSGEINQDTGLLTMARDDFYIQKLFANANRGLDKSSSGRDIIDLAMMIGKWGDIPARSWEYAYKYYGDSISRGFHLATDLVTHDDSYFNGCLAALKMNADDGPLILRILEDAGSRLPLDESGKEMQNKRIWTLHEHRLTSRIHESLWHYSSEALESDTREAVRWADVERKVIADNIGHFPCREIANVIMRSSPGAVSPYRQKFIYNKIERLSERFGTDLDGGNAMIPGHKMPLHPGSKYK